MSMRETETPVKVEVIEERFRAIPDYVAHVQGRAARAPIDIDSIAKAIAAYERTIEPGIAPFDRWIEGDEAAISESAKRGFVLFNGKADCFALPQRLALHQRQLPRHRHATKDPGRGRAVKDDALMQFAFKTPTLRSVAARPPFMHDGSAATLIDVIKHYEKGGIDRPSRSPLMVPMDAHRPGTAGPLAFMETLTGMPEAEPPPKQADAAR